MSDPNGNENCCFDKIKNSLPLISGATVAVSALIQLVVFLYYRSYYSYFNVEFLPEYLDTSIVNQLYYAIIAIAIVVAIYLIPNIFIEGFTKYWLDKLNKHIVFNRSGAEETEETEEDQKDDNKTNCFSSIINHILSIFLTLFYLVFPIFILYIVINLIITKSFNFIIPNGNLSIGYLLNGLILLISACFFISNVLKEFGISKIKIKNKLAPFIEGGLIILGIIFEIISVLYLWGILTCLRSILAPIRDMLIYIWDKTIDFFGMLMNSCGSLAGIFKDSIVLQYIFGAALIILLLEAFLIVVIFLYEMFSTLGKKFAIVSTLLILFVVASVLAWLIGDNVAKDQKEFQLISTDYNNLLFQEIKFKEGSEEDNQKNSPLKFYIDENPAGIISRKKLNGIVLLETNDFCIISPIIYDSAGNRLKICTTIQKKVANTDLVKYKFEFSEVEFTEEKLVECVKDLENTEDGTEY